MKVSVLYALAATILIYVTVFLAEPIPSAEQDIVDLFIFTGMISVWFRVFVDLVILAGQALEKSEETTNDND